jgi:hypothetical protein
VASLQFHQRAHHVALAQAHDDGLAELVDQRTQGRLEGCRMGSLAAQLVGQRPAAAASGSTRAS